MKHTARVTKLPAKAICGIADHPGLIDSLKGFIEDPLGTLNLHLDKEEDGDCV